MYVLSDTQRKAARFLFIELRGITASLGLLRLACGPGMPDSSLPRVRFLPVLGSYSETSSRSTPFGGISPLKPILEKYIHRFVGGWVLEFDQRPLQPGS
jgi:hypothetical protein